MGTLGGKGLSNITMHVQQNITIMYVIWNRYPCTHNYVQGFTYFYILNISLNILVSSQSK